MDALTLLEKKIRTLVQSLQDLQAQHIQLQKEHEEVKQERALFHDENTHLAKENTRLLELIRQLEEKQSEETQQLHLEKTQTKRVVDELLARIEELPLDIHGQDQEQQPS